MKRYDKRQPPSSDLGTFALILYIAFWCVMLPIYGFSLMVSDPKPEKRAWGGILLVIGLIIWGIGIIAMLSCCFG